MPKQERKYQSDTESHEPRNEQKRSALQVSEIFQHCNPFRNFLCSLSENLSLKCVTMKFRYIQTYSIRRTATDR